MQYRKTFCCLWQLLFACIAFADDSSLIVNVGAYENYPKIYTDDDGRAAGLFPDILHAVAASEGFEIRYVQGTWAECLDRLERGEIDIMADVAVSPERMNRFDFNHETVLNSYSTIYTAPDISVQSYFDLENKRIAVMKGSINYTGEDGIKSTLEKFNISAQFSEYDSYREVLQAVSTGNVDAGVVSIIFGFRLEKDFNLIRSPIVFNPSQLRFAFTKNSEKGRMLSSRIDTRLAELKKDNSSVYYEALNRHIYGKPDNIIESKSVSKTIHLTESEREWIRKHPHIRIGIDPEFVPFEYRDEQGRYQGISSDYVRILNERLGLNMRVVSDLSWKRVMELVKKKDIDVLPCVGESEERKEYLHFSKPYAHYQRVIIMLSDAPFITGLKDIQDKKVGVQAGSSHEGFLKEQTSINAITYPTLQEGLMALSGGQIQAFVANIASASYWIRKLNLTNLKVAAQASFEIFSLRFAVRKDFPELVSVINKGLSSITSEEEQEIQRKWVTVEYKTGIDPGIIWKYVFYVSSVLIFVVSFILFWNYRLKKEIIIREKAELELEKHAYELEKANARLKELDHLKNMFIASVSHELRTPLNSIIGFTGIILKGLTGELNSKQKDQLSRVYSCANHLLGLITDVIDISKIEAGRIDIYPKKFQVIEAVQEAITSIQPQAQAKSLSIGCDVPEDIIVNTDRKRFQQCILNYLNNAVKYSETGTIKIAARDSGDQVEVKVSDTGIGIAPADMHKLFEPFERIDSHLRVKAGGTGLGLYLTRKIAQELLGGDISVESELNKGSVFGITIRKNIEANNEAGIGH